MILQLAIFHVFVLSMVSITIDAGKGVFTLEWVVQCVVRIFRPGSCRPISDAHLNVAPILPF